jgi:hypothetical protein
LSRTKKNVNHSELILEIVAFNQLKLLVIHDTQWFNVHHRGEGSDHGALHKTALRRLLIGKYGYVNAEDYGSPSHPHTRRAPHVKYGFVHESFTLCLVSYAAMSKSAAFFRVYLNFSALGEFFRI